MRYQEGRGACRKGMRVKSAIREEREGREKRQEGNLKKGWTERKKRKEGFSFFPSLLIYIICSFLSFRPSPSLPSPSVRNNLLWTPDWMPHLTAPPCPRRFVRRLSPFTLTISLRICSSTGHPTTCIYRRRRLEEEEEWRRFIIIILRRRLPL